jgi:hypothetical protein
LGREAGSSGVLGSVVARAPARSVRPRPALQPVSHLLQHLHRDLVGAVAAGEPHEQLAMVVGELLQAAVGVRDPADHQHDDARVRVRDVGLERVERRVLAGGDPLEVAEFQVANECSRDRGRS